MGKEIIVSLLTRIKKTDSSPVTESWERNARDCTAKVHKIWNITKNFLKKFSRQTFGAVFQPLSRRCGPCHTSLPLQSAACRSILYQFVCVGSDAPQCALPWTGDDDRTSGLVCRLPYNPGTFKAESLYNSGEQTDCRKAWIHHSIQSGRRTDLGVLGFPVEQRVRTSLVERSAQSIPIHAKTSATAEERVFAFEPVQDVPKQGVP